MVNTLPVFAGDFRKWFANTWEIENRREPLPRLGALQLLKRRKGACDDMADLSVFTLRSQGIPATIDQIPFWGTTSGQHFFNVCFENDMKPVPFDVSTAEVKINNFSREPSKVIRYTYSKQPDVLASIQSYRNIPPGFMQAFNYKDVTSEYWNTRDLNCELHNDPRKNGIAYACVFNDFDWRATWWAKVKNNSVVFNAMCSGVVYLPAYFYDGKLHPTGYPVILKEDRQQVLKPDIEKRHAVSIEEKDKYLFFRPGKVYALYYWDSKWVIIAQQKAVSDTHAMLFDNVPRNALLLLVPEYSQHRERPFTIGDDGTRTFW